MMTDGSGKGFDLSRGEGIPSFSDIWGTGEPITFADVRRVEPLLVHRLAYTLELYRDAERAAEQAEVLPDGLARDGRIRGAKENLERARIRRDQALMDVAEMFCAENPFRSREEFMDSVERRLGREAQPV